jgi:hypothetical protein
MREQLYDPERWRQRAEELRAIAEAMTDPAARESLLRSVADYLRLADRSEARRREREASSDGS